MSAAGKQSGERRERIEAVAYMRTSSASNVGADKDSEQRQRAAIQQFADRNGYVIAESDWYYDAAVSGADPVDARDGFLSMMERIKGNGVRTIIVETASRFARDLMVQEIGFRRLRDEGINLIAADSPQSFVDDTPTASLIRQVLGAVAEFDRAMTVAKLKGARDRKSAALGRRVEGRKGNKVMAPEAVALAKRLHRRSPKTGERRSLREIAQALAEAGHVNERGKPYHPQSIRDMIRGG